MHRLVATIAIALCLVEAPGCIAYRSATPAWLDGQPPDDARGTRARRKRGVIASSVGLGELAIAAGVTAIMIAGGAPVDDPADTESPAGALGAAGKALVAKVFADMLLLGVGATALISGLGDVGCGVGDLLSAPSCDVRGWESEPAHPAPTRSAAVSGLAEPAQTAPIAGPAPAAPPAALVDATLLVGDFELRGVGALRLGRDGHFRVATDAASLAARRQEAVGTWRLDGDQLTLTSGNGACAHAEDARTGVYRVSASRIGLRLTRLRDPCSAREAWDGQTWWRVPASSLRAP